MGELRFRNSGNRTRQGRSNISVKISKLSDQGPQTFGSTTDPLTYRHKRVRLCLSHGRVVCCHIVTLHYERKSLVWSDKTILSSRHRPSLHPGEETSTTLKLYPKILRGRVEFLYKISFYIVLWSCGAVQNRSKQIYLFNTVSSLVVSR